ncbi:MAG: TRAP transporter small permease [Peptostreptococcaceae bacterium]
MEGLRKGLNKVLELVCCTLMAIMTVLAFWQVASRYVFNKPSTATEELLLISFVWMGLLGGAYLFGKQEHMRMSFFAEKFSAKNQVKIRLFSEIVVCLFAALVLVYGGFKMSGLAMAQASASLRIPMGYIYAALPLSGIITMIFNVMNTLDIIKELKGFNTGSKKTKVA